MKCMTLNELQEINGGGWSWTIPFEVAAVVAGAFVSPPIAIAVGVAVIASHAIDE